MVTSLTACHAPSPETTSGRNREYHKTLKNSETAAYRRVKHKDTKVPYSVGLSNSDTFSSERRRLLPISAFGSFCQNEDLFVCLFVGFLTALQHKKAIGARITI
jgi:hypothetical protein